MRFHPPVVLVPPLIHFPSRTYLQVRQVQRTRLQAWVDSPRNHSPLHSRVRYNLLVRLLRRSNSKHPYYLNPNHKLSSNLSRNHLLSKSNSRSVSNPHHSHNSRPHTASSNLRRLDSSRRRLV